MNSSNNPAPRKPLPKSSPHEWSNWKYGYSNDDGRGILPYRECSRHCDGTYHYPLYQFKWFGFLPLDDNTTPLILVFLPAFIILFILWIWSIL